jgi:acyl carrier protein
LKILGEWRSPQTRETETAVDTTALNPPTPVDVIDKDEIFNCVSAFLVKNLKLASTNIHLESKIADFNIDSIHMAELSVELEKIVKHPIPEKIFYDCPTLQDLVDFLIAMPAQKLKETSEQTQSNIKHLKTPRKIAVPKFTERFPRKIS